jgi:hypothetical protein
MENQFFGLESSDKNSKGEYLIYFDLNENFFPELEEKYGNKIEFGGELRDLGNFGYILIDPSEREIIRDINDNYMNKIIKESFNIDELIDSNLNQWIDEDKIISEIWKYFKDNRKDIFHFQISYLPEYGNYSSFYIDIESYQYRINEFEDYLRNLFQ